MTSELDSLQSALTAAAQADDAERMAELLLAHARQAEATPQVSQTGDVERARAQALWGVATAQAEMGAFAAALETAQRIADANERSWALRVIAEELVKAGKREEARETFTSAVVSAQEIEHPLSPAGMIYDIVVVQAKSREFAAALETAHRLEPEGERAKYLFADALVDIVSEQARAGEFASAFETVQSIEQKQTRVRALASIGVEQHEADEHNAARATLSVALTTARGIEDNDEREWALGVIASALAWMGEFADALEIAFSLRGEWKLIGTQRVWTARVWALKQIAAKQARAGEFAAALETAYSLEDTRWRAGLLWDIAVAQAEAGEREAAQAIFATLVAMAQEMEDARERVSSLMHTAVAQAAAGEREAAQATFAAAIEAAQNIEREMSRAWALRRIAVEQARRECGKQAVQTAEMILTDRHRHLPAIATTLADAGDKKHFKQLLIPCAFYLDAAYKMCGLLAQLYPAQAAAVAEVVKG